MRVFSLASLLAWMLPFAATLALGQDPVGLESYASRPDPLLVLPQAHPELGPVWAKLRRAHIEAVAQILEVYPEEDIYFLARDAELHYDLARWVTRQDPVRASKLHLLNVSRTNRGSEHLTSYLAQEGISEESLRSGKKIVFVDTGQSGGISASIAEQFPKELRSAFRTQLMSSSTPFHPSSYVFLSAIDPRATRLDRYQREELIYKYEDLPRHTDRSVGFERINGQWQPMSRLGEAHDGIVSPQGSRALTEDLLHTVETPQMQTLMKDRRALWHKLRDLAAHGQWTELETELRNLLAQGKQDPFLEAVAVDFVELSRTRHIPASPTTGPLRLSQLGWQDTPPKAPPLSADTRAMLEGMHKQGACVSEALLKQLGH